MERRERRWSMEFEESGSEIVGIKLLSLLYLDQHCGDFDARKLKKKNLGNDKIPGEQTGNERGVHCKQESENVWLTNCNFSLLLFLLLLFFSSATLSTFE